MDYVEIHFHLLPGVDDGPASAGESLSLAASAVADGTRTMVATPHVNPLCLTDPSEIPPLVQELEELLRRERIPLRVLPDGELGYEMVERLRDPQLELIVHGPQLTAGAFTGLFGGEVRAEALRVLRFSPRVAIASDAHGAIRMPTLREALRALKPKVERPGQVCLRGSARTARAGTEDFPPASRLSAKGPRVPRT